MSTGHRRALLSRIARLLIAGLPLHAAAGAESLPPPRLQDLQIAGRVLGFLETPPASALIVAVVYDPANAASLGEAQAIAALMGDGLAVGGLVLRPLLVKQAELASATGFGAVFAAAGVSQSLLQAALDVHKVPCLTRDLEQVEHGSCIVAIRSSPSVSIVLNGANAERDGVHFATAFRMMVREL